VVVTRRAKHPYPEVYCDFNARKTDRGYSLEKRGSVTALGKLGLTLEESVGKRFTFVMDDVNEKGEPDDIMFNGVVVKDPKWGYLAVADSDDVYWRSQLGDA
jgi:hypothetical protein